MSIGTRLIFILHLRRFLMTLRDMNYNYNHLSLIFNVLVEILYKLLLNYLIKLLLNY